MEGLVEKRRFIWNIKNFTRERLNAYNVSSDLFEIGLGDNKTKWRFRFYPRRTKDYSEFYVHKEEVDDDNFTILLNAAVRTSDYKIVPLYKFEEDAKEIKLGEGWGWGEFIEIESIFDAKNKYLLNDTLTLIIDLKLRQHDPPKEVQQNPLADAVTNLFDSKKFSDITLICSDDKKLPAHRFILDSRSSVFSILLAADMLEKKTSRVVIDDIDRDTMHEVLRFIYTNTVQNLSESATKLIYAAEKYDLQDLKSMCAKELMTQVTTDTVFELLVLADHLSEETLLEECMDFIDSNLEALKEEESWKKISNDLVVKCMQYIKENSNSIISLVSSL